jgi:hypothetical protein
MEYIWIRKIFDNRIPITPSGMYLITDYSLKIIRINFIDFKYINTWQYYSETPAVFCFGYPYDPNIPNWSF